MNIKNTIYSIIPGILIFSAPVYAIDTEDAKETTSFFGQIFGSFGWNSIKNCGPIVAVMGGTYGAYWCYSKYNYNRNLQQPNVKRAKELLNDRNQMNNEVGVIKNNFNNQGDIINNIDQKNNKNEKLVNEKLSPLVNALEFTILKNKAEQINENQQKVNGQLNKTSKASKEINNNIGAMQGVFATMSQSNQKAYFFQYGHLKNIGNDFNAINENAKQANEHLDSANKNLDEANDNMKKQPDLFKQQLEENRKKQNEQKKQSQKLENRRQNHILNVTPLTRIKVN